eukprot:CAMPEP_0172359134 /NCGR_PEP_ID=MMETSP1060-20121228/3365_1 /TAXON_ID=37318 /ORGANISM="Pseudo-nitzschia pungens, Strain cf. cingulata" /LENGTH=721 /DNA_ID=CAMNT_0013080639 /DNA_START=295 /DNA_END=2463 /DNA_ORIENTATION=+
MRATKRILFFLLLVLACLLTTAVGEETAVDTVSNEVAATAAPDGETAEGDGESEGDDDDDDDGFEIKDLLPGFNDKDSDNFVKNYILGKPEYYQEVYDAPDVVPKFNGVPRFGHSDEFALLLGDTPDNYYLGILFLGTLVVTIFVFWAISVCLLKCIGPQHVGFLAGFPFRREGCKSAFGRVVLSVSAWMMIISTIVLITKGLTGLQQLSDTVAMTARDIQLIEKEVQSIVTLLLVVSAKTTPIRDELVDFLKRDICPLEPGSDTEDQIRSVGEDTYDAMVDLDDFIEGYLTDVEDGVEQMNKFTNRVEGFTDRAQFVNNPKVTAVVFPYFIVPAILMVAVCMGWWDVFSETFYTVLTWGIMPLLVLMTVGAIVAAAALIVAIQSNSDLCVSAGAPEDTILGILNRLDLEDDSGSESKDLNGPSDNFFYDVMVFYTYQCTTPNPWAFLEGHYGDLARGREILGEFIRSIEDTTLEQLSQECGQEYGPIVELLFQLQDLITTLSQTSIRALTLMSCRNIVPLYTTSIYDATCTQAPVSFMWVFSCTVLIAFFGMMCIMFRGAYYPIDYYYYDAGKGERDLYPTDEDSYDDHNLADTLCNELVLKEQEEQCIDVLESLEDITFGELDVYLDDEKKEDDEVSLDERDTSDRYEPAIGYDETGFEQNLDGELYPTSENEMNEDGFEDESSQNIIDVAHSYTDTHGYDTGDDNHTKESMSGEDESC